MKRKESPYLQVGEYVNHLGRFNTSEEAAIRRLIAKLGSAQINTKTIQNLTGKESWVRTSSPNQAEVIPSKVCSGIIAYYAFESKAANDTAKYSLAKFSTIGIDNWIKEVTGYVNNHLPQATEILNILNQVLNKVDRLEQETKEYRNLRGRTVTVFPALDKMLEDFTNEEELLPEEDRQQTLTLTEWVLKTKKGITLDKSTKHRLALLVAETYRSTTGKEPNRDNRYDKLTKKQNINVSVYDITEFPILQLAWNKLFN